MQTHNSVDLDSIQRTKNNRCMDTSISGEQSFTMKIHLQYFKVKHSCQHVPHNPSSLPQFLPSHQKTLQAPHLPDTRHVKRPQIDGLQRLSVNKGYIDDF